MNRKASVLKTLAGKRKNHTQVSLSVVFMPRMTQGWSPEPMFLGSGDRCIFGCWHSNSGAIGFDSRHHHLFLNVNKTNHFSISNAQRCLCVFLSSWAYQIFPRKSFGWSIIRWLLSFVNHFLGIFFFVWTIRGTSHYAALIIEAADVGLPHCIFCRYMS